MFTNILLVVLIIFAGFIVWKVSSQGSGSADAALNDLKGQLGKERSEKDELAGKGKELFARFKDLEADFKSLSRERDSLQKRVAEYEAAQDTRERELDERLQKLSRAEKSLEDEKIRVRREDEERQQQMLAERDRLWNEHEQNVIHFLGDLCAKPEFSFACFDNEHLPEGFDGSFKPDFLVEFLGQYIIFDAKVSRSDNFQNYISDQVKKTAKKAKDGKDIYQSIFLVVPTDAIGMLKSTVYYEQPYTFYVVSPEALPPILASLKKITHYELAEQFDPAERENIIGLIAKLDSHINARAAFDVLLAKMGTEILSDTQNISPGIAKEVNLRKEKIRIPTFKPSEVKRLIGSAVAREEAINELVSPKATIEKKRVEEARAVLGKMG